MALAQISRPRKRQEYPVTRTAPEKPRTWLMAAFDFETEGLHGKVVFGSYQYELEPDGERSEVGICWSERDMLDAMLAANRPGMRWYAHNAQYDEYYLIDAALDDVEAGTMGEIEPVLRGNRSIFRVTFHPKDGAELMVFDSMAIADMSLKKLAAAMSTVGGKGKSPDFKGGEIFDVNNAAHRDYAIQDTRALLDSMVNFNREIFATYRVNIKGTISATAVKAWTTSLDPETRFWRLTPEREEQARLAYFGGLSFLTDTRQHRDVVSLDVNSMYPHCMRTFGVPDGELRTTFKFDDGSTRPAPGLYYCDFEAPEHLKFGCIGYRDDLGMCFPRGRFTGWAYSIEIARALRWGYGVKIQHGFCWEGISYPFTDFVDLCEAKRAEHKGQPVEMVYKLMQNSVYGKLGMKPEGTELRIVGKNGPSAAQLADDGWDIYAEEGKTAGASGRAYLWEREVERDAAYMLPHWAGWITAQARGVLFDAIEAARAVGGEVICGDTDSLKLSAATVDKLQARGLVAIGAAYGQWKIDARYDGFRAYAPKCYAYFRGQGSGVRAQYGGKAKGIPQSTQTAKFHEQVFRGKNPLVKWQSSPNLLSVLKGGAHATRTRTRLVSLLDNSDNWFSNSTGDVKSVKILDNRRVKD
jgi:hypothetical protein